MIAQEIIISTRLCVKNVTQHVQIALLRRLTACTAKLDITSRRKQLLQVYATICVHHTVIPAQHQIIAHNVIAISLLMAMVGAFALETVTLMGMSVYLAMPHVMAAMVRPIAALNAQKAIYDRMMVISAVPLALIARAASRVNVQVVIIHYSTQP